MSELFAAYEETTNVCSICPSRCLLEGFELAPMFDNLAKTGWPTQLRKSVRESLQGEEIANVR